MSLILEVKSIIQDDSGRLTNEEIASYIDIAITDFAKRVGVYKVAQLELYDQENSLYLLPSDFVPNLSVIKQIIDDNGLNYQFRITPISGQKYIQVLSAGSASSFYAEYSYLPTEDQLDIVQKDAIRDYVCYLCMISLASYYAQTMDPVLSPDVVNYGTRTTNYLSIAQKFLDSYLAKCRSMRYIAL